MVCSELLCWISLCSTSITITESTHSSTPHKLLNALIDTPSKDPYIQYITNLTPGTNRYSIGAQSILFASHYRFDNSDEYVERVLLCLSADLYHRKTGTWENSNVNRYLLPSKDVILRGYHGDQVSAEITVSELWKYFETIWQKHHRNHSSMSVMSHHSYPIKIITDTVLFNLDIEYERHSTEELDSDQQRGLRFTEGGDDIATQGYYEIEIPTKNIYGIRFVINEGSKIVLDDIILRIKKNSRYYHREHVFDVDISIAKLMNKTYEIDDCVIRGNYKDRYNAIMNGDSGVIQLINQTNGRSLSDMKRIKFVWRHYEIIKLVETSYYSHTLHESQKVTLIIECLGRESRQINLLLTSTANEAHYYRLKLLEINRWQYVFETNKKIIAGQYRMTILLSTDGTKISETKIGNIS